MSPTHVAANFTATIGELHEGRARVSNETCPMFKLGKLGMFPVGETAVLFSSVDGGPDWDNDFPVFQEHWKAYPQ